MPGTRPGMTTERLYDGEALTHTRNDGGKVLKSRK
jgi:hypothetical protein